MPKAKQITVACENRPGVLAQVGKLLGDANINILALLATTSGSMGFVGLVVDKPARARKILTQAGLKCGQQEVLHLDLPNVPGALARFAQKLADRKINITAAYQTTVKGSKKARIVFGVSDLDRAMRVR